ncbi:unnamed protein product, partial [Oikopleura dioica]
KTSSISESTAFLKTGKREFKRQKERENMSVATNLSAVTTTAAPSIASTTTASLPNYINQTAEESLSDLQCSCSCEKSDDTRIMRVFNMTISEYTQTTPPKEEKPSFDHLATFKFVMMPSFATFLILTAGFYMLAGYTSGKQMDDLKKKLNQEKESQDQPPPNFEKGKIETIVEEKSDETKFNSPCLTDQREDAFYKDRTSKE